ncbi:hypothetical protein [Streptomyces sp. CRN 30]|uniref:hypothetical protein n=1 Tax=Streptomyces sp. CRN 30 TaxID=3075613 RepID=UPI002A823641|nr:hypothetical protein [Streptomyces sp. CRN 30]
MDGGHRHWNEETQRWESGPPDHGRPGAQPAPPHRPPDETASSPARDPARTPLGVPTAAPPPDTGPYPPVPAALARRNLWVPLLTLLATAGLVVSLVTTLGSGDGDGEDDGQGPGASTSVTAPVTTRITTGPPSPTASATPSPPGELPAGYVVHDDPQGFRIAVPRDWVRTTDPSEYGIDVVHYRSPGGDRRLQVFQVSESTPDESFEKFLAENTPYGFVQLSLENLDDAGFVGSLLEYVADSLPGEREIGVWHILDLRFVAEDEEIYALVAYGPDADGADDERELLTTAFSHFCPPATTCPAP